MKIRYQGRIVEFSEEFPELAVFYDRDVPGDFPWFKECGSKYCSCHREPQKDKYLYIIVSDQYHQITDGHGKAFMFVTDWWMPWDTWLKWAQHKTNHPPIRPDYKLPPVMFNRPVQASMADAAKRLPNPFDGVDFSKLEPELLRVYQEELKKCS